MQTKKFLIPALILLSFFFNVYTVGREEISFILSLQACVYITLLYFYALITGEQSSKGG